MSRIDGLLQKASDNTGLADFGEDSYLEGLTVLVGALEQEANLNAVGEHVLWGKLVKLLSHRLQIEHWYRQYPGIDDETLLPPLIGVGLPRSGSTALSNLLSEDPSARSFPSWLAMKPCPPPSTVAGTDPRIAEAQKSIDVQLKVAPQLAAMVPVSAHGPAECLELMALDFKSTVFGAFARIPSYDRWLIEKADLHSTYRYELRTLKLLQWGLPTHPWRLKTPSHLLHIETLADVWPDAKFVCTHRDPLKVLPSCVNMYDATISMFTDNVDRNYIGSQNLAMWATGIGRLMRFRDGAGDSRCYDIDHLQMQRQPIEAVEGLYEWLGEPISPDFRVGMQQWWQENAADRQAATYAPLEHYGVAADEVNEAFAAYVDRFITIAATGKGASA